MVLTDGNIMCIDSDSVMTLCQEKTGASEWHNTDAKVQTTEIDLSYQHKVDIRR